MIIQYYTMKQKDYKITKCYFMTNELIDLPVIINSLQK